MTWAIVIIVALLVIGGGVFAWRKQQTAQKQEKVQSFLRSAIKTLEEDQKMLSDGDVGWRPLAKGESGIGLSMVVPSNPGSRDTGYNVLAEEAPQLAEGLKQRDKLVEEVSRYAEATADKLEAPVRRVVDHDKEQVSSDPETFGQFKHLLLKNEEVWMMVLQSLINNAQNADGSTQYGKYWRARHEAYEKIAGKKGGKEYEKLGEVKEKLTEQNEKMKKHLKKKKKRMEHR